MSSMDTEGNCFSAKTIVQNKRIAEFTINLGEPIKPGKVTIGYFDGTHPSIVAVTRTDKIFIHNPHNRSVYDDNGQQEIRKADEQLVSTGVPLTNLTNDLNFLNINQAITCIATGSISSFSSAFSQPSKTVKDFNHQEEASRGNSSDERSLKARNINNSSNNTDVLVVGTNTSIHVYDILHNTDLYYKEIPDGANTLAVGEFGKSSTLALIGGNCAIHGFDRDGTDAYWMVTGDNISAMALVDVDCDNQNELVVGSEGSIQVFKKDAIIIELTETDKITCLCSLGMELFAYALANGTIGVYRKSERLWRIKSKNQAMTLFGVDIENEGQMRLITGWSNGKLDIRVSQTGEVLYRENFRCSIAGVMMADYNIDGKQELIVITTAGDVFGYRLKNQTDSEQAVNLNIEQDTIRNLMKRKQNLRQELHNYEENNRMQTVADPLILNKGKVLNEKGERFGAIPVNTKIKSSLILKLGQGSSPGYIELKLSTNNSTEIRAVIVFAEGLFKYESLVVYPREDEVKSKIFVPLYPTKDVAVDIHVKALVGNSSTAHYHVFELSRHLPRFSMFMFIRTLLINHSNVENILSEEVSFDESTDHPVFKETKDDFGDLYDVTIPINKWKGRKLKQPTSYAMIRINEPASRVVEWINFNFLLVHEMVLNEEEKRFEFVSLRDQSTLIIEIYRYDKLQEKKSKSSNSQFLNVDINETYSNLSYEDDDVDEESPFHRSFDHYPDPHFGSQNILMIYSESIELTGLCVQSICEHLDISDLPCIKAHFPEEIRKLEQLVDRVDEIQMVRQRLIVEVADTANLIRAGVVQAEDARLIEDYQKMKQIHNDLAMLNRDIMREYKIRCQNHQDLVDGLKQINVIIQKASNLRIGSYKTTFINSCREAIKNKNFAQLFKIISED